MKHIVIFSVLFVLILVNQKSQQTNITTSAELYSEYKIYVPDDYSAIHYCDERIDSACPATEIEPYTYPQSESSDTMRTNLSGKYFDNGFINL